MITRFDVGDSVYGIRKKYVKEKQPCPHCNGVGKVATLTVPPEIRICKGCYGVTQVPKVNHLKEKWDIECNGYIQSIQITSQDDIDYEIVTENDDEYNVDEKYCYKTEDEALEACRVRNEKEQGG